MSQQQQQTNMKMQPKKVGRKMPIIDKNAPGMDSLANYSKTNKKLKGNPKKSSKKAGKKGKSPSYAAVRNSIAKTMGH